VSDQDWRRDASCTPIFQATKVDLWFSDLEHEQQDAKTVCLGCPVRLECLAESYEVSNERGELVPGIWGALDHQERKALRNSRRMARNRAQAKEQQ
jgi:WhiB family redox-sensing transcriptional regulator